MKSLLRSALLLGLAALLLAASMVSACSSDGSQAETSEVVVGWLADQTGASSGTFKEVVWGWDDYMAEMESTNPIPGVKVKTIAYDMRLEYARVPQGYEWLKGQGTSLLLHYLAYGQVVTASSQANDKTPSISFGADIAALRNPYQYQYSLDYVSEGRVILDYIIKDWWQTRGQTRPVKVGLVVAAGYASAEQYWAGFQASDAANPGKCVLTRQAAPTGQTAWASEVAALKDSDVVVVGTVGPAVGTFMNELKLRGYQGQILGTTVSIVSAWTIVTGLIPKADLDGIILPHAWLLWTDENSFVADMRAGLEKYRPDDADRLLDGTAYMTGWSLAHVVCEIVRQAADEVGPENVNNLAIDDVIQGMNLSIDGLPPLTLADSKGINILQPYLKMIRYDASKDQWYTASDWLYAIYD